MREILTLSLPAEMTKTIKKRIKARGYNSVSEYFKYLLEADEEVITANDLIKMAKQARRDYKAGKLYTLKSPKDLLKL